MLKRGITVVVLVTTAIIAGTVWLLTRGDSAKDVTPEEAVLATCHADPANPPRNLVNPPGGDTLFAVRVGTAVVSWTARGQTQPETALVERISDGRWQVVNCKMQFSVRLAP